MRRFGPLLLITFGVVSMLSGFGLWRFQNVTAHPGPAPLPDRLAGLALASPVYGEEAVGEISRLHSENFLLSSAAVGIYGQQHPITIWVTGTPVSLLTSRLLEAMKKKIGEGQTPFHTVTERKDRNRTIYELEGMGQKHFYFQSHNLLVWLAADPDFAELALEDTLKFYP